MFCNKYKKIWNDNPKNMLNNNIWYNINIWKPNNNNTLKTNLFGFFPKKHIHNIQNNIRKINPPGLSK